MEVAHLVLDRYFYEGSPLNRLQRPMTMLQHESQARPYGYGRLDMIEGISNATANKDPSENPPSTLYLTRSRDNARIQSGASEHNARNVAFQFKPPSDETSRSLECDRYKSVS